MDGDIMTWLNITETQQLYDSMNIDIVRTYNESPNGYTRTALAWTFLSPYVAVNQRKLNTARPEITTATTNTYAIIKFTSPIARSLDKSDILAVAGSANWLVINEDATSDVPLIDVGSFDFAQYFYYITLSFAIIYDVNFANGGSLSVSPLKVQVFDLGRKWMAGTTIPMNSKSIGYSTSIASTTGVGNIMWPTSSQWSESVLLLQTESGMTFSFNLENVVESFPTGAKYIGFVFDASRIPMSSNIYQWVIDKVQFEIKRIRK